MWSCRFQYNVWLTLINTTVIMTTIDFYYGEFKGNYLELDFRQMKTMREPASRGKSSCLQWDMLPINNVENVDGR